MANPMASPMAMAAQSTPLACQRKFSNREHTHACAQLLLAIHNNHYVSIPAAKKKTVKPWVNTQAPEDSDSEEDVDDPDDDGSDDDDFSPAAKRM